MTTKGALAEKLPLPRPLYIAPQEKASITVEGPALTIERPESPAVNVPLRRVSRIHLAPNVTIETTALLACAQRGIVLVFHDDEENPVARIIGNATENTRLRQRLIDLTDLPDWQDRYHDWRRAMERRICNTLRNRLDAPWALKTRPDAMKQWIQQRAIALAGPRDAERTSRLFRQLSITWMQSRLLAHGVGAENELWTIGEPDLARDLGTILAFRIETARLGWLRGRAEAASRKGKRLKPLSRRTIIARFEKQRGRIERLGDDIVNRLHRWLVEIS